MNRLFALLAAPLALATGACATDGYGYGGYGGGYGRGYYGGGIGLAYGGPYAYDGYYDGFYGPIHDGYWGNNGYFYYRGRAGDRYFRRGDRNHFYRGGGPRTGFNSMHGSFQRQPGLRTPSFPRGGDGLRGPGSGPRGGFGGRGRFGGRGGHRGH